MMPLSRHALSLQTGLHRWFILGTVIPPTMDEMRKWASCSSLVTECVNIPHWELNALYKGKYSDALWPWLDDSNVLPAGPSYPPGVIRFFVLAKVEAIGHKGKYIRAHYDCPFRCPDADADV